MSEHVDIVLTMLWGLCRTKRGDIHESAHATLVPLTAAYDPKSHGVYLRHLQDALSGSSSTRNIALTGGYGSGKSSVLNEVARLRRKQVVTIALSTLGDDPQPSTDTPASDKSDSPRPAPTKTNRIQKEIVKQLLYREEPINVRSSRFRRISRFSWGRQSVLAAFVAAIALGIIYSAGVAHRFVALVGSKFGDEWYWHAGAYLAVFAFVAIAFIGIRYIFDGRVWIEKLSAGPATVTLSGKSGSYFDEYLDEIVYFFEKTRYDIVVFEDIDRFNDPHIFETLREMNTILNNSKQLGDRQIRFVYALRDSIFERLDADVSSDDFTDGAVETQTAPTDRTKFFDLVIPIVPFITHKTARDLMAEEMRPVVSMAPDVFDVAARHITDMRLIKNIRNEFVVFNEKLLDGHSVLSDLTAESLFALLVYKNVHLSDFEAIKTGTSQLDDLYRAGRDLVDANIDYCNNEIRRATESLSQSADLTARAASLGDRLENYLQRLDRHVTPDHARGQLRFNLVGQQTLQRDALRTIEFWIAYLDPAGPRTLHVNTGSVQIAITVADLQSEFGEDLSITAWTEAEYKALADSVKKLEEDKDYLRGAKIQQLLDRNDFRINPSDPSSANMEALIEARLSSPLARELIRAGHIDWNFTLYVGQYYGTGRVSLAAMNYVMHHVQPNTMGIQVPLSPDDVEGVLRESPQSLGDRSLYNISILDHLLSTGSDRADSILESLTKWEPDDQRFVAAYTFDGKQSREFITRLSPTWPKTLVAIRDSGAATDQKIELLDAFLTSALPTVKYDADVDIRSLFSNNHVRIATLTADLDEAAATRVAEVLLKIGVELPSLDQLKGSLRQEVVARYLYRLTPTNLADAAGLGESASLSLDNLRDANRNVYQYAIEFIDSYLENVVLAETDSEDEPRRYTIERLDRFATVLSEIADQGMSSFAAVADRAAPACELDDITVLPADTWPILADLSRFKTSCSNIRAYVEQHSVDAPLAKLLTESPVLTSCDNEPAEARHDLALKLVNVPAELLSAEIRSQLVTSLGASQLEVDLLRRETGPLYSLLIAGNSIADDVTSWTHIASMSDWPTTELALKASKRFAEFASTALIPSDHLEALFGSLIVPHEIKVAMLRLLEEYGQVDTPALTAAARFALDQKGSPSPTLLVMFAKSRVPQNLIIELSVRRPVPLSQAELLNICEALGDPYAALVDPAIQTPSLPDNPDNRELIAILKKHFPSWRHTTLRKTSEVKLTKYPG